MPRTVDYYLSVASPWAYLGHGPFVDLIARLAPTVVWRPVLPAALFAETGGVPLPKRHPARQAYRLMELQRWRDRLGVPLVPRPAHAPFDPSLADRAAVAIAVAGGDPAAYLGRAHAGVWARQENLADPAVVGAILAETGHEAEAVLAAAQGPAIEAAYADNAARAVAAGVFGVPSWVVDGEVFWGQDRLDFLADMLTSGRPAYSVD
jgi:2-hydroxychromene-2-carboxylate isomerase